MNVSRQKKTVYALVVTTVFFVLLEGGLRQLDEVLPAFSVPYAGDSNPNVIWSIRKDVAVAKVDTPARPLIFVYGASTMQGYPFLTWTPCNLLEAKLKDLYPDNPPRVVNGALAGQPSTLIKNNFLKTIDLGPDLVLWCYGANDFLPGNAGQTIWEMNPNLSGEVLRFFCRTRIFQGLAHILYSESHSIPANSLLIQNLFVEWGDPEYGQLVKVYEENLLSVVASCRQRGIPLLIATDIAQVRDGIPGPSQRTPWPFWEESTQLAVEEKAVVTDLWKGKKTWPSDAASAAYLIGKILLGEGNDRLASYCLRAAKDLCSHRNRVPEAINAVIRRVARDHHTLFCDLDEVFSRHSPDGIPGRELVMDWMHPNEAGVSLLTTSLASSIREKKIFTGGRSLEVLKTEVEYAQELGFSSLEQGVCTYRQIYAMKQDKRSLEPEVQRALRGRALEALGRDPAALPLLPSLRKSLESEFSVDVPEPDDPLLKDLYKILLTRTSGRPPAQIPPMPPVYPGEIFLSNGELAEGR